MGWLMPLGFGGSAGRERSGSVPLPCSAAPEQPGGLGEGSAAGGQGRGGGSPRSRLYNAELPSPSRT